MAEYFELAAMRDRDESQPAGPVLTASTVGAETAMSIDEAETPQDRQAYCSTPGALLVFPRNGKCRVFFSGAGFAYEPAGAA
jgi:hypothetical protein